MSLSKLILNCLHSTHQLACQSSTLSTECPGGRAMADLLGRTAVCQNHVSRSGIIRRGVLPTCIIAALALVSVATAQTSDHLPDAGDAVTAWMTVEGWAEAFDTPAPEEPGARLAIRNSDGACVVLRRSGRIVGAGNHIASDDDLSVRRAAGHALAEVLAHPALERLTRQARRAEAGEDVEPGGMTLDDVRAMIGPTLTVELEVAGPLQPIVGRSEAQLASQIQPGIHGIAIRRGTTILGRFPSQLRATEQIDRIDLVIAGLIRDLGVRRRGSLSDTLRREDIAFYRFETIDLAQNGPDGRVIELVRGTHAVEASAVTPTRLIAAADALASHLTGRLWPADAPADWPATERYVRPVGLKGDYTPQHDDYRPAVAPPFAQSIAALALRRYARAPGVDLDGAVAAEQAARTIVADLAALEQTSPGTLDRPGVFAALAIATHLDDEPVGEVDSIVANWAAENVMAICLNPKSAGSAHELALIAAAAARLSHTETGRRIGLTPKLARLALEATWDAVPDHLAVSLLPWAIDAEIELGVANVDRVITLRDVLHKSRLGTALRPCADDLRGGFALTPAQVSANLADSQTIRPATALFRMLRTDGIPAGPDDREHCLAAARFILQLQIAPIDAARLPSPARAVGGLRRSPWNGSQPIQAQAMGLLALSELLESIPSP